MISLETIKLLTAWNNQLFDELSISEIMHYSKKNSKPWVFNSLKLLTKNKLLISKRKSNLNLYSLNLKNPLLIQTLNFLEAQTVLDFPKLDTISEAIEKIPSKDYCLLVFGSYSKKAQKKDSDLDIALLIKDEQAKKNIKPYFNEIKLSSATKIDEHYITYEDFMKMLLIEEENLGKQIFRDHKLFYNPDIYYQLIKEAHKNGFRL